MATKSVKKNVFLQNLLKKYSKRQLVKKVGNQSKLKLIKFKNLAKGKK